MQAHYKPGTRKKLSPRDGDLSVRWAKLVLRTAGCKNSKEAWNYLDQLWRAGYSHKDAGEQLKRVLG